MSRFEVKCLTVGPACKINAIKKCARKAGRSLLGTLLAETIHLPKHKHPPADTNVKIANKCTRFVNACEEQTR